MFETEKHPPLKTSNGHYLNILMCCPQTTIWFSVDPISLHLSNLVFRLPHLLTLLKYTLPSAAIPPETCHSENQRSSSPAVPRLGTGRIDPPWWRHRGVDRPLFLTSNVGEKPFLTASICPHLSQAHWTTFRTQTHRWRNWVVQMNGYIINCN